MQGRVEEELYSKTRCCDDIRIFLFVVVLHHGMIDLYATHCMYMILHLFFLRNIPGEILFYLILIMIT